MDDNEIMKVPDGIIMKAAEISTAEVTPEELKLINKHTLSPVEAGEVFTFKAVIGDNELDDRNYEPFNLQALKDLKKLYVGKTVIKDHWRKADNQIARIYDTELISEAKTTGAGEAYAKLVAKCYMIKTASNADLIAEIKGGIKREVSSSCRPRKVKCSICGVDNAETYCAHWAGKEYDTAEGKKTCYFTLDGAKEAYELSLVAVPAQPRAGTTKAYGGTEPVKEPEPIPEVKPDDTSIKDAELRMRANASFLYSEQNRKDDRNE